jgi:hypothetical protein
MQEAGAKAQRRGNYVKRFLVAGSLAAIAIVLVAGTGVSAASKNTAAAKHVLLLSVDGLHQTDLEWYVTQHPSSALAKLVHRGVEYSNAQTPFPSDSFPGMVAQVTGGNPSSTGVYYDDSWNRALFPAGTTSCTGPAPGAEVTYFEQADKDLARLDAGQGLPSLPGDILQMTGNPTTLIDPAQLPVDPATCTPVYPHQYIKVNTIFEVARSAGLRTAWSDKHAAYEILNGPSGTGIQDLFTPEINSDAPTVGSSNDWTTDNALTMQYDSYKVQAVINEINGLDHSGTNTVGTPAIFGMNFQTVSTAEKLPTSNGLTGGYLADGRTPGPLLTRALDYINAQVGAMTAALKQRHLQNDTVIILSAKHGQSPQNPAALYAHQRRHDHRRVERGVGSEPLRRSAACVVFDQRRRHADLVEQPLLRGDLVREELPARVLRHRQRHQRSAKALHELRACERVRRSRRGGLHARAAKRRSCARPDRDRAGRLRLHR